MSQHVDILDEREDSLRGGLYGSLALHLGIVAFMVVFAWWSNRNRVTMGSPDAMGGAVGITPVNTIPLPQRSGDKNPLANDTESQVPSTPKEARKTAPREEPDAIPLNSKKAQLRPSDQRTSPTKYQYPVQPNQLTRDTGPAVSNPMYGGTPGVGGIGIGKDSILGSQFGAYANLIVRQVANRWGMATASLPPTLRTARRVLVRFEIRQDGTISNPVLLDRSGVPDVDYAAQRAILNASPFPKLPPNYPQSTASVELTFELQR